jgi:hypothetical protein
MVLATVSATASEWKIGMARREITPTESIYLAGHANKSRFSTKTLHPLWVKAMAIEGAAGERVVIVAADIFGIQRPQTDEVWSRIKGKTGLDRAQVAINFSHCHALPILVGVLPPAYKALVEPPEHWDVIERYTKRVQDAMVEAVSEALEKLQPATLEFGEDLCDIRDKAGDIKHYTDEINMDRPFYDRVPVIRIKNAKGEMTGVLFGYPTHAQSAGNTVHGGYMGYACLSLEQKYPGTQAMFLLGTGALTTIRGFKYKVFQAEASEETGALLFESVERALAKPMMSIPCGKVVAAADEVELPFQSPVTKEDIRKIRVEGVRGEFPARAYEFQMAYEDEHGKPLSSYHAFQQVFRLGDELTMVFLSGEVAEGYSYRIAEMEYPGRRIWVLGFSNDQYAYVPTEGVLNGPRCRVGGASQTYWGWPSKWDKGIEDRIIGKVKELITKVDGK